MGGNMKNSEKKQCRTKSHIIAVRLLVICWGLLVLCSFSAAFFAVISGKDTFQTTIASSEKTKKTTTSTIVIYATGSTNSNEGKQ